MIALDARGHGRSPVPDRPYTLAQMAGDARDLLERLGIERAHWVGLSMGGMVGQAFALAHPGRLRRLVDRLDLIYVVPVVIAVAAFIVAVLGYFGD